MKILILEDELSIREELAMMLMSAGYESLYLEDFEKAAELVHKISPDLILLDINLEEYDGFSICKEIREFSQVPIIFLTGKNTSLDELKALTLGGDDYITKPYHPTVLLARIAAVLKRTGNRSPLSKEEESIITYKGLTFDLRSYKIKHGEKEEELSKNEYRLLYYLLQRKQEVIPRLDIVENLWDNDVFIDDNALSVSITRLRNKLEKLGLPDYIETKRGVGYKV